MTKHLLFFMLGVAGCMSHDPAKMTSGSTQGPTKSADPKQVVANLAFLATGTIPAPATVDATVTKMARGELNTASYVDALLDSPDFAKEIAPRVLLAEWQSSVGYYLLSRGYILKKTAPDPGDAKGQAIYYLRESCTANHASRVSPWWNPDSEVLVCSEAYQPDHLVDEAGHHCDGIKLAPGESKSTFCGCGPNLMRCYPDVATFDDVSKSVIGEVNESTRKVVGDDRPLRELYTSNETFRDRNAELLYRRGRVETGELKSVGDLRDWPEQGKWAPRPEATPGQHAGILTSPQVIFRETGLRAVTKNIFDKLWCKDTVSANVEAAGLLSLHSTGLRAGEGWEELANRPVCESCHARMDYGMQFMKGYTDVRVGAHFVSRPVATGPMYSDDSNDLRGTAPLTPKGFAELAVKQPEFVSCMVQDVTRHVFNNRATQDDMEAVTVAMKQAGTLRSMMRVALLRYADSYGQRFATSSPVGLPQPSAAPEGQISLSTRARALVEEHCSDCHSNGSPTRDLGHAFLARATVQSMLSDVAFERMPKNTKLGIGVRAQLVSELIASLWSGERERQEAYHYFGDRMSALPIHRGSLAFSLVRQRADTTTKGPLRLMENSVRQDEAQFTPGFAMQVGLEAIRACKASGKKGDALERCIEAATLPGDLVNGLDR